ncbi:hypothetical protein FB451DRAFT_1300383 [Mycena latifolia]|nr:hypothetical protein FB451DRAFT_1300383 [Mycena latifolia]
MFRISWFVQKTVWPPGPSQNLLKSLKLRSTKTPPSGIRIKSQHDQRLMRTRVPFFLSPTIFSVLPLHFILRPSPFRLPKLGSWCRTWCARCARSITCSLLQRDTAVRPSISRNSSFIPMPLPAVSSLPSSSFCLLRLALPLANLRFGGPVPPRARCSRASTTCLVGVAYVQSTGYWWLYSILVLPRSHPRRYDRSPRLGGTAHCA